MPPKSLGQVLARLGPIDHPAMLAGSAGFEDAGVYRLDDERALVQTTDFFPPIVDDPRWYGRIAAANALSDVYAMGGRALTVLNIVGWPKELDVEILGEILAGGMDKVREAGAALCGGHTVLDHEIKYGLAVTGEVHPDRFWRNSGAREGDVLIVTKPLGMGPLSTGIKKGKTTVADAEAAMHQMAELNRAAAEAVADEVVHAATDVTGFGLLGHGCEMAEGAGLTLVIELAAVPLASGAYELAERGIMSGGSKRGREAFGDRIALGAADDTARVDLLFDAETSGGLLLAVPADAAERCRRKLAEAGTPCSEVIGEFQAASEVRVIVR